MRCLGVLAAVLLVPAAAMADPCATPLTFTAGRSALAPASKQALAPALDALRAHRELKAHIVAPPDALSKKRGDSVKWFLVDAGVEVDRIDTGTGGAIELQIVGCNQSLVQTVSTQLAPAKPAAATPLPHATGSIVDDASGLAELLAGSDDDRRSKLDASLASARKPTVTIGHDDVGFRGEPLGLTTATGTGGLRLASATLVVTQSAHHDDIIPTRTTLETGPSLSAIQGTGQPVKLDGHQLRALSRCYRKVPGVRPKDSDDVELTFGVDRMGKVIEPVVISDEDALVGCIGSVMTSWRFPALKKSRARIWLSVVLSAG